MHWKQKVAIQNLMGKLPPGLGNPIYYEMQRRFGGLRQPTPVSRLKAGVEVVRRIQRFERPVESATFLEVGTGHQMALPLSLWLAGAAEVTTVDLNPYLRERLVLNDLDYLSRHEEEVRDLFGDLSERPLFEERFVQLIREVGSLRDLFALTGIRYLAPADAGCLAMESNIVDFHVSFTVLEHIPPAFLKRVFLEGCRVLKPDGLFVHHIDFSDHFAHADDAISSVNFLQFTEPEWERLAGNRYMFHNRLRVDEFQHLLRDLDLRILALESRIDAAAAELLQKGFPLVERFRDKDLNINAARDAWVVAAPPASLNRN